jgi:hypothetical protein
MKEKLYYLINCRTCDESISCRESGHVFFFEDWNLNKENVCINAHRDLWHHYEQNGCNPYLGVRLVQVQWLALANGLFRRLENEITEKFLISLEMKFDYRWGRVLPHGTKDYNIGAITI